MWSEDEEGRLRDLRISPYRTTRDELVQLIRHFKQGNPLYHVVHKGTPIHKSKELAAKVRELTKTGQLDWLVPEDNGTKGEEASPEAPWRVRILREEGFSLAEAAGLVRLYHLASTPECANVRYLQYLLQGVRRDRVVLPGAPLSYLVFFTLARQLKEKITGRGDLEDAAVFLGTFQAHSQEYDPWSNSASALAFWDEVEQDLEAQERPELFALVGFLKELVSLEQAASSQDSPIVNLLEAVLTKASSSGQSTATQSIPGTLTELVEQSPIGSLLPQRLATIARKLLDALRDPASARGGPPILTSLPSGGKGSG